MESVIPSSTEIFVLALSLVRNELVDTSTLGLDPAQAIAIRMEGYDFGDDRAVTRTIKRVFDSTPPLLDCIDRLCRFAFSRNHGLPTLRESNTARRLVRAIDPDVLVCLHPHFSPPREEAFDWSAIPMTNAEPTAALLAQDSVDTHIHLGGSLPPLYYWVPLMGGELGLETLAGLASDRRRHAKVPRWRAAITRAAWLRVWLAAQCVKYPGNLGESRPFPHIDVAKLAALCPEREPPKGHHLREIPWLLIPEWLPLRDRNKDWPFVDALRKPCTMASKEPPHYAEGERRLLYSLGSILRGLTLRHSREEECLRQDIEANLREYLCIRNAFHQWQVHDRGTDGLYRFVESFGRRSFYFGRRRIARRNRRNRRTLYKLERNRMAAALDAQIVEPFHHSPLSTGNLAERRIEMRVSLPTRGNTLKLTLRAWLAGIQDHLVQSKRLLEGDRPRHSHRPFHIPENIHIFPGELLEVEGCRFNQHRTVGLIVHLIKRGGSAKARAIYHRQHDQLIHLLEDHPGLRPFIVGIDAAGEERGTVPRVLAKSFLGFRTAGKNFRPRPHRPPLGLGFTYHVGEDVEDLLTGLRHIDEVASLLLPSPQGGRLGHALALGEHPERFYLKRGMETEPEVGAHLLDLVWAFGKLLGTPHAHLCHGLVDRIIKWAPEADSNNVINCWRAMGYSPQAMKEPLSEGNLLKKLNFRGEPTDPALIQADDNWIALVAELQLLLRKRLALRRICIEANPTSNLLVGGYAGYECLPYETFVNANLPVSLNTDDPGLFMTCLPAEFAAMYNAFQGKKPHRQILDWLTDRMVDARRSAFPAACLPFGLEEKQRCQLLDILFQYQPE